MNYAGRAARVSYHQVVITHLTSYGVYISQLIRFARVSRHVTDFNTRNKLLKRYYDLISKFQIGLKSLFPQGLSEPEFYGALVYKLKKIVSSYKFSAQFIKIISHYKKIGYDVGSDFSLYNGSNLKEVRVQRSGIDTIKYRT